MKRVTFQVRRHISGQESKYTDLIDDADKEKQIEAFYNDLIWLDPSYAKDALRTQQGPRAPKTCEWIMNVPEVKSWLQPESENQQVLWLSGTPGRGKSTLAMSIC